MKRLFAVASLALVLNVGNTFCSELKKWENTLPIGAYAFGTSACGHVVANLVAELISEKITPTQGMYGGAKIAAGAYTVYYCGKNMYTIFKKDLDNSSKNKFTAAVFFFLGGMSVPFNFSLRG